MQVGQKSEGNLPLQLVKNESPFSSTNERIARHMDSQSTRHGRITSWQLNSKLQFFIKKFYLFFMENINVFYRDFQNVQLWSCDQFCPQSAAANRKSAIDPFFQPLRHGTS